MADRESILEWLGAASYRRVPKTHPARGICDRLVMERRAIVLTPDRFAITQLGRESLRHHSAHGETRR